MDEETKLSEIWSSLDAESRERAVALFVELAYRFVLSQQRDLSAEQRTDGIDRDEDAT